jgi:CSLREA domain-containing protein
MPRLPFLLLLATLATGGASAQSFEIVPQFRTFYHSSDDGRVAVGLRTTGTYDLYVDGELVSLGLPQGGAQAVNGPQLRLSGDGEVLMGSRQVAGDPGCTDYATRCDIPFYVRWDVSGVPQQLPRPSDFQSLTFSAGTPLTGSEDGDVLLQSYTVRREGGTDNEYNVLRWTNGELEVVLRSTSAFWNANAVSADGQVLAGRGQPAPGAYPRAARYDGTIQYLDDGEAFGVSPDGVVLVGTVFDDGPNTYEPFRWQGGTVDRLGYVNSAAARGTAEAIAVSRDGTMVLGYERTAFVSDREKHSTLWVEGQGIRRLQDVLQDDYGMDLSAFDLDSGAQFPFLAHYMTPDGVLVGEGPLLGTSPAQVVAWKAVLAPVAPREIVVNSTAERDDESGGSGDCDTGETVTRDGKDEPECTLRAAIRTANARAGRDSVSVDVPGAGPHTVVLASPLPAVTDPAVLDATTQPGYAGAPLLAVDAAGQPLGLDLAAAETTVRGLSVGGATEAGVLVAGPSGVVLEANWIGVAPSGAAAPNGLGVEVRGASGAVIGSVEAGRGNVISGNVGHGVWIADGGSGAVLLGNRIGTDAAGTGAVPNGGDGVRVEDALGVEIGGPSDGEGNVISGNEGEGVRISGEAAAGAVVAGNRIGTTADGLAALGNGNAGVEVDGAPGARIGGDTEGARNVISGNGFAGVSVEGETADGVVVAGNYVGVDATGVAALPNDQVGIAAHGVQVVGAPNARVGGTTEAERNVVLGGIQIGGTAGSGDVTTDGVRVQGNYVNLGADGVTVPDADAERGIDVRFASGALIGGARGAPGQAPGNVVLGEGIRIFGDEDRPADDLRILGNLLGTDATGSQSLEVGADGGITVSGLARGVEIGGAGGGNVVVLDGGSGIQVEELGASAPADVSIVENTVGMSADGGAPLGSPRVGIDIGTGDGVEGVVVADNRVSATAAGIRVRGPRSDEAQILRNTVGLLADGSTALPDEKGVNGIAVFFADRVTLDGNIVGNFEVGVVVAGNEATLIGNRIGTNPAGTQARPNEVGLIVPRSLDGQPVGNGTVVGAEGAGNVISGNLEAGLQIGSALSSVAGGSGRLRPDASPPDPSLSNALVGVRVAHNRIGTNASGTGAVLSTDPERGDAGVFVVAGSGVVLEQNLISGNLVGVLLAGTDSERPEGTVLVGNRIGLSQTPDAFVPNQVGVFVGPSEDTRFGATVVEGAPVGNRFGGSGTHLLVSEGEAVQVRLASFLGEPAEAIAFGETPPADAPPAPRLLTAYARDDDAVARVLAGVTGPIDVLVTDECTVPKGAYAASAAGSAGAVASVLAGDAALGTADPVGLYLTATLTSGPPDAPAATSLLAACVRIADEDDIAEADVPDDPDGVLLDENGIEVTAEGADGLMVAARRTRVGGGTLFASRYPFAPEVNTFEGSATAPNGETVTPEEVSGAQYWTLGADGLDGLVYGVCLSTEGLTLAGPHVVMERAGVGRPWRPLATTAEPDRLCASGLTGFGDLGIGSGASSGGGGDGEEPTVSFDTIQTVVAESAGVVRLRLVLSQPLDVDGAATVTLVSGDPADVGGFTSVTVPLPAGVSAVDVEVPVTDDQGDEGDETLVFALSVTGARLGAHIQTALVIVDDDAGNMSATVPAGAGPRFLAVPVSGITARDLADAAGGPIWTLDGEGLVPAEAEAVLVAGQSVVVGGARAVTVVGGPAGDRVSAAAVASRSVVAIGNPTGAPVALAGLTVEGGDLGDLALVFEDGAFRAVSPGALDADAVLPAFTAIVVDVTSDDAEAPAVVTLDLTPAAEVGEDITSASFRPAEGETAVVLSFGPPDGGRDVLIVRLGGDVDDPLRQIRDLQSPVGPSLAVADESGALAALAVALETGTAVEVPLALNARADATHRLTLDAAPEAVDGRPLTIELVAGTMGTALVAGEAVDVDPEAGPFALRFSVAPGVGVADVPEGGVRVGPVYPNPTRDRAGVEVALGTAGPVRVAVFDVLGREVAVVHDGDLPPGTTSVALGGRLVPGAYLVRVSGPMFAEVRRLTVMR